MSVVKASSPQSDRREPRQTANDGSGVAEWAVVRAVWPKIGVVGPISKSTAQRIYHPGRYNPARTAFTDLTSVLYRGDEATAKRLADQLLSSAALGERERKACTERQQAREAKIIASATQSPEAAPLSAPHQMDPSIREDQ